MGCNCESPTSVSGRKPYRKPIQIPFGQDLRIKIQGVQEKVPYDFDSVQMGMEVYEAGIKPEDLPDTTPLFTFIDSDFERIQSDEAQADGSVTWNDTVVFHKTTASELMKKLCYEVEYPFIVTENDLTGTTYTRWISFILKQGLDG